MASTRTEDKFLGVLGMEVEELSSILEAELPGCKASVMGDGHHFEAVIIGEVFAGKKTLERSRIVYNALGQRIANGTVHALSMKTYTQAEWEAKHN